MCDSCGCATGHKHDHNHGHKEEVINEDIKNNPQLSHKVTVIEKILSKNNAMADEIRKTFDEHKITCFNMMSSPGSGKTTTLENLADKLPYKFAVIEGDLETSRDAERIRNKGIWSFQLQTGRACHLDAGMVKHAIPHFPFDEVEVAFIENVGNLVCPASYDVGAHYNMVFVSVPEGDDKIEKYPVMFRKADIVVITKADMLEFFDFDVKRAKEAANKLKPGVPVVLLNNKTGEGLDEIIEWIKSKREEHLKSLENR
ncbi:hydrogenase nickel incorporation protein HypB [Caminibacter pacificus]|uniref:Hydrogenase nickel incorporation protein HypB n=1 Tax=Caminibacter pacificus TaxID=1424653 RepID=A0AAJ4UY74_9BACT|nr:hydrogenase nickel incorporation protein HypB [Caminibacter pacificus]NPA88071.1 hydrogenase nickel incorporation protein HypB [Campylobacterota bacterium]QCI28631.1 hydrogenase nickel incorporation protein HypB [Caminibacter pacificus]ROR40640.1 hydrogenase nickel incorporation protein HypB [Caminibacter pacificus]